MNSEENPVATPLVFLLINGAPDHHEMLLAIRMLPYPDLGGANVATGPTIPIPWSDLTQHGIRAFNKLSRISIDDHENTDLAPGTGKYRRRKTLLVDIGHHQMIIKLWKRLSRGAQLKELCRLTLPITGDDLERTLRNILKKDR